MQDLMTSQVQKQLWREFRACLTSEVAEGFLKTLLTLMQIMLVVDYEYRRNIVNFKGRYQFLSKDGHIIMAAIFANNRMEVRDSRIDRPDITIIFRDGRTLLNFLFSPRQDILGSMLRHDLGTEGNLNYLYKLGYMARQLQLRMPQL